MNVDTGYVYKESEWRFMEGVFPLLRYFKEHDFLLLLATNQSGIARGYYRIEDFIRLSNFMQNALQKELGFMLDGIYFCPHAPSDSCMCRKPRSGMIKQGIGDFGIDPAHSFIIGDKMSDIEAGSGANIAHRVLFESGGAQEECFALESRPNKPTFIVNSLISLINFLEKSGYLKE